MYDYDSVFAWIQADPDVIGRPDELAAQLQGQEDPVFVWAALWGLQKNELGSPPQIAAVYAHLCLGAPALAAEVLVLAAAESPHEMLPTLALDATCVADAIARLCVECRVDGAGFVLNALTPSVGALVLGSMAVRFCPTWAAHVVEAMARDRAAAVLPHLQRLHQKGAWWVLYTSKALLQPFLLALATKSVDEFIAVVLEGHRCGNQHALTHVGEILADLDLSLRVELFVGILCLDKSAHPQSSGYATFSQLCKANIEAAMGTLWEMLNARPLFAPPLMDVYARFDGFGLVGLLLRMKTEDAVAVFGRAANDNRYRSTCCDVYQLILRSSARQARAFVAALQSEHPGLPAALAR
jgi:hypothetical protein